MKIGSFTISDADGGYILAAIATVAAVCFAHLWAEASRQNAYLRRSMYMAGFGIEFATPAEQKAFADAKSKPAAPKAKEDENAPNPKSD